MRPFSSARKTPLRCPFGPASCTDHEVVAPVSGAPQPGRAVARGVDREALGLEPSPHEREDPRLVLDHQDAHLPPGRDPNAAKMTCK